MNTTIRPAPVASRAAASWQRMLGRARRAWNEWRGERRLRSLDAYHRRQRDAFESYLGHARDHYELERMERDWQRRHADTWRVL